MIGPLELCSGGLFACCSALEQSLMRICDGGRRLARLLCLKLLFIWGRFDKHMARFDRFVGAGIAIMMLLIGAPLLLVGSLFAWQLLTRDGDERTFKEPEGRWRLVLEESCLIGPCYKYAKLIVRDGYVSRQELRAAANGYLEDGSSHDQERQLE